MNNIKLENFKTQGRLLSCTDWVKTHAWPPIGGLRYLIFHADSNGFNKVIRRCGKRVLINEDEFFKWVDKKNEIRSIEDAFQESSKSIDNQMDKTHGTKKEIDHYLDKIKCMEQEIDSLTHRLKTITKKYKKIYKIFKEFKEKMEEFVKK